MNDFKDFYNREAKKYTKKSKTYKIINRLIQSIDGDLLLSVSKTAIMLSVTGVGLIVVPIASSIGARVSIFSRFHGFEYLKREEQHKIKDYTLADGTLNNFQKQHTKYLEDKIIDLNENNKLNQTNDVYKNNKANLNSEFTFFRATLFSKEKKGINFLY